MSNVTASFRSTECDIREVEANFLNERSSRWTYPAFPRARLAQRLSWPPDTSPYGDSPRF